MYKPELFNRGYFGIGVYHPKTEVNIGTLMRSAFCFSADFIFTVGKRYKKESSDTVCAFKHVPLFNFQTIEDLHKHIPRECQLIGVEIDKKASRLDHFQHPERCIYLLGAEDHGLPKKVLDYCHHLVEIPFTKMCLNVATAGSIIIYDRIIKRQSIKPSIINKLTPQWEIDKI